MTDTEKWLNRNVGRIYRETNVERLEVANEQLVVIKNCAQALRAEMKEHPNNQEWWWQAAENLDAALKENEEQ